MGDLTFDQVRYPVGPVLAAQVAADPELAGPVRSRLRTLVGDLVRRHLDAAPGFFVLGGLDALDEAAARRFTPAVSALVGELLPQDSAGTLVRDVRDRGLRLGEGRTGRYSDSRQGGSLHTDGPHAPFAAPECFALFCVRQSATGGDLVLVHIAEALAGLPPGVADDLRGEFHFDRRQAGADPPTVAHPVLSDGPAGATVRYLREYIELGHAHPEVPDLTAAQRRALDGLDAQLADPALQRTGKLAPGEVVFVNNLVLCHGRTAFVDDAGTGPRLMLRTWIRRAA